ncbi:hypothetical protein KKB99_04300 [bacterium]|nr:hypothetical protein [bacterium]MBU1025215.1 hypothetical protein [bacterium]
MRTIFFCFSIFVVLFVGIGCSGSQPLTEPFDDNPQSDSSSLSPGDVLFASSFEINMNDMTIQIYEDRSWG